ncbi:MAG: hypothetical protein RR290_04100 [Clostridia bacterium]
MKVFNFFVIIFIIYFVLQLFFDHIYNLKKYKSVLKEKSSNIFTKLIFVINDSKLDIKIKNINIVTTFSVIIFSIILFICIFVVSYNYLKIFSSSLILASISIFLPYNLLKYISYMNKQKIIKIFPNYILSLKNYTDVNNDIVEAFSRADVQEPLKSYINKFNISVQKGIRIYDAFEGLKNDINIKRINEFLTLLQFCYINGGNFTKLLDKFSKIQMKINIQNEKEKQEIFSSKLVLILLILLNIYILFGFILQSKEYFDILTCTVIGKLILNLNILSYIVIMYIYTKLNKMEE